VRHMMPSKTLLFLDQLYRRWKALHADENEYLTKLAIFFEFIYGDAHVSHTYWTHGTSATGYPSIFARKSKRLSTIIISMTRSHQRRRRLRYSRRTTHLEPGPCSNSRYTHSSTSCYVKERPRCHNSGVHICKTSPCLLISPQGFLGYII
jgi:hypothetical protein